MTGKHRADEATRGGWRWTTAVGLLVAAAALAAGVATVATAQQAPDDCRDVGSPWTCEQAPPAGEGCEAFLAEPVCQDLPIGHSEECQATPEATTRECWTSRLDENTYAMSLAVDTPSTPDEAATVYVASGTDPAASWDYEFLVTAYDGETGERLWETQGSDTHALDGFPDEIAVSPDGSLVAVTGSSGGTGLYDADTGELLWPHDPGTADTAAYVLGKTLEFGPDGDTLYVAAGGFHDAARGLHALDTTTPTATDYAWFQQEVRVSDDESLAVAPDGSTVYATRDASPDRVLALDAGDGSHVWSKAADASLVGLEVDPQGEAVYALGSQGDWRRSSYHTVALEADTGALLWNATFGASGMDNAPIDLEVDPIGTNVYVTGTSLDTRYKEGTEPQNDIVTIRYDAEDGERLWLDRYEGPAEGRYAGDWARAMDVGPSGQTVFVVGASCDAAGEDPHVDAGGCGGTGYDYATLALDAEDGSRSWVERYDGNQQTEWSEDVAVDPTGARVYITGGSQIPCDADSSEELRRCGFGVPYQATTVAYGTDTRPDSLGELLDWPGETVCRDIPAIVKTVRVTGRTAENIVGEAVPLPDQVKRVLVRPAFYCDPPSGGGGGGGSCGETVAEHENTTVTFEEDHEANPMFGHARAWACADAQSDDTPNRTALPDNGSALPDDPPGPFTNETSPYVEKRGFAVYLHEERCRAAVQHGVGVGNDLSRERYVVTC